MSKKDQYILVEDRGWTDPSLRFFIQCYTPYGYYASRGGNLSEELGKMMHRCLDAGVLPHEFNSWEIRYVTQTAWGMRVEEEKMNP
jgi:hypothetical protein